MDPTFPVGKICVVGLSQVQKRWRVLGVREATPDQLVQADLLAGMPLGWSIQKERLLSPWSKLGKAGWPSRGKGSLVCAETGRPALLAGGGVDFSVEALPPKVAIKYKNPDGDGEYKITVKNKTDKQLSVPALLSDGKQILWEESLVILSQGKVYPCPGAKGVKQSQATVLKPGQAVSTVINPLKLQGPEWPRGGYRIEFQFALGEKSATQSFYYMSRHHDVVREKLLGKQEK